jgi:hypothetical protein
MSMIPTGFPNWYIEKKYSNVGIKVTINSVTPAKYFANNIFMSEIGRVNKSSIVPVLLSSAIERMVIAGIKIKKMIGAKLKKGIKSASVPSNKFV